MPHDYDHRTAATFDPSVLGYTKDELEAMGPEERTKALTELLNQAADLLQATASAFEADLNSSQKGVVSKAAREVIGLARSIR